MIGSARGLRMGVPLDAMGVHTDIGIAGAHASDGCLSAGAANSTCMVRIVHDTAQISQVRTTTGATAMLVLLTTTWNVSNGWGSFAPVFAETAA